MDGSFAPPVRPSSSRGPIRPLDPSQSASHTAGGGGGLNASESNNQPHRWTRPATAPLSPSHANNNDPNASLPRCRLSRQVKADALIPNLPSLRDTPPGVARRALLLKKLRLCSFLFDSSGDTLTQLATLSVKEQEADAKMREIKRITLLELINYYTMFKPCFSADEYSGLFDMLAWNLFRPLPPSSFELHVYGNPKGHGGSLSSGGYTFSPEEDPQQEDPNWGHVQMAYELLLRLVSSSPTQANTVQQPVTKENPHPEPAPTMHQLQTSHKLLYSTYLSRRFILSLLNNFSSEDIRERDYLKTILHRIYAHSMQLRPFIRRNIQHILSKVTYEDEKQHGIAELLEILGSIINGFAVPIKDTHVEGLLKRILIPLHKTTHLSLFHPQLSYCLIQFLEKDFSLADLILTGLLKYWPRMNSKKEVLFLNELEELCDRLPVQSTPSRPNPDSPSLHPSIIQAIFHRITSSVFSTHFQVSEKAIYMLNERVFRKFVFFGEHRNGKRPATDWRETIVPMVARAIFINTEIPVQNSFSSLPLSHSNVSNSNHSSIDSSDPPRASSSSPASALDQKGHWNSTITELTRDVLTIIESMDPALWSECMENIESERKANNRENSHAAAMKGGLNLTPALIAAAASSKTKTKVHQTKSAW